MSARKVSVDQIPKELLGDLQTLITSNKKEYIVIGNNYYEVFPTSAVSLMEAIADLIKILDELREKKVDRIRKLLPPEEQKTFNPLLVVATVDDIITDRNAVESLKALIPRLLEGVDPQDLEAMNIGQLVSAIDKIITVNTETLPPSYRKALQKKQEEILNSQKLESEQDTEAEAVAKNP